MTREMCDAAVTKVRFDTVQFIRTASIPFSLPDFTISEAGHFIAETVELRAAFAASSARSLPRIPV